jgi:trk system potassium uptake protein TrkH
MNIRLTLRIQGGLLIFLGCMLLTPIGFSLAYPAEPAWHDGAFWAFLFSALLSLATGGTISYFVRPRGEMTYREGFGIVTLGWIGYAMFGSLPYLFAGVNGVNNPVDAVFEAMSGFSTTGATTIFGLDDTPRSILFWRSMTQWLGGMGIIVLSLAILPFLGVGGMQLFEAEAPGPTKDRLSPRIQDTAKLLWGVYVLLTVIEAVLLYLGGMNAFESLCHSLTTMATGGFSTRDASIAAYNTYTHVVISVFMLLAGVNFALHYHALRREVGRYRDSEELRFYLMLIAGASLVVTVALWFDRSVEGSLLVKLRDGVFQTISLMTTTGYATADYEKWPAVAQFVLMAVMFVGGCAGSTAGSVKVVRILLLAKHAILQLSRLIHPSEVRPLKLDHKPVSREVIQSILGFFALFMAIFLIGSGIMAGILPHNSDGHADLLTGTTAVISALGNVGPALGAVGPTETYTHIPALGKIVLAVCMLVGRLEVFTVLVLFFPSFWRK